MSTPPAQVSPDNEAEGAPEGDKPAQSGLLPQVRMMLKALRGSAVVRSLVFLILSIVLVIIFTAYGQIRLNRWNKPFFDALSRRDLRDFLLQLGVFFIIIFGLLVLNVAQRWLVEMLKLKLRQGIVNDLLRDW